MADADVLDRELRAALRTGGHRVTLPRLLVHRHLRAAPMHVSAEQLYSTLAKELPSLSPATVYSTLDLLEQLGLVRRMSTPGGTQVFDSRMTPHQHAICRSCGAIADLEGDVALEGATRAAERAGFAVDATEVLLRGLCSRCAARRTM